MKRREFISASAGILIGTIGHRVSLAATPCPPQMTGGGASSSTTCGSASGSSLAEVAGSLSPGQSAQFTKNTLQDYRDIQWQLQTIFYDAARGEIQYMGKPASSQSTQHSHYLFSEATGNWTDVGVVASGSGHIWSLTFDEAMGDYYFVRYSESRLRRFRRSNGVSLSSWETLASTSDLTSGNIYEPILGWHPNLFGPGKGGVYAHATFYGIAYNPENNTWTRIATWPNGSAYYNIFLGQALYLPGSDRLALWADGNSDQVIWIDAGAGLESNALGAGKIYTGGAAPITIAAQGGTTRQGHVVFHPDDRNRLLIVEEHGSSRVWSSTDDGDSWQLQSYTHPFQQMHNWSEGEYTVGTIAKYGVVIGMTSDTDGGETVLWKPNT